MPNRTWKRRVSLLWGLYLILSLISTITVFEDFLTINKFNINLFNEIQPQEDDKFKPNGLRVSLLRGGHSHKSSEASTSTNSDKNEISNGKGISSVLLDIESQYSLPGWADTRWPFRKNITINTEKVAADVINFPMFIELFDPNLHSTTQPDGDDIVFTDYLGNQLDHEIEVYNPNFNATHAHLVAWIRMNLSSTQDSLISMYYGNQTVTSQEYAEGVWDGSYVGVWHLNEQFGNSSDSTSFKTDGMVSGGVTRGLPGKTGLSYRFDPSGRFNTSDPGDGHLDFGLGDFSISFWSNVNQDTGSFQRFLQKGARWAGDPGYSVCSDDSPISYFRAIVQDSTEVVEASPGNFAFDTWLYVVTQLDRSTDTLSLFVNGALVDSSNASLIGNIDSSAGLEIPSPTYPIDGFMDEIRLSNIVYSNDWIATEFNNQLDPFSFYFVGMEEQVPDIEPPIVEEFGVMDLGMGTATFWANITDTTPIVSAEVRINGTNYIMSFNGTHWIYQLPVEFGGYYEYQIFNASDSNGNNLTNPTNLQNYIFNLDNVLPDVLDWEYITINNTFQANVTDPWGEIDTVLVNVTTYNLKVKMVQYTTFGIDILAHMNDTLNMPNGPIDFQIIVNDTSGNEFTSLTRSGNVFVNHAPIVGNLTLTPFPLHTYDNLTLTYDYYDMDGDPEVTVEIRWFRNAIYQPAYDDLDTIPASALIKGDVWNFTVKSYDGLEWSALQASSTIIVQNSPPILSDVTINGFSSPNQVQNDTDLVVGYIFADVDGDPESIPSRRILWYRNGMLMASLNDSIVVTAGNTSIGEIWNYTIRVSDGIDYSTVESSPSATIAVTANSPPVVGNLTFSPFPLHGNDNLTLSYDYYDMDGDPEVTVEIRWFRNAILQPVYDNSFIIPASALSKGDIWNATVRSYDGLYWSNLQTSIIIVQNSAPVATNVTLTPLFPNTSQILSTSWVFLDIDLDIEAQPIINWYRNGIQVSSLANLSSVLSTETNRDESWYYTIQVSDGTDYSSLYFSNTVVIINSAPTASNVQINLASTTIYTTDSLTVTWAFNDPDPLELENISSVMILWYLYGVEQPQFENKSSIPANYTLKNQEWLVSIGVRDIGGLWSDLVNSSVVVIANSPPTVNNIVIIPEYPNETENLVANWDYYDADGDPQNTSFITWYKNGVEQVAFMNLNIIHSSETANGEDWYFTIHIYDGTSNSTLEISPHVVIGSSLLVLNIESPTETTYSTKIITINLTGNVEYYWYFIEEIDTLNQSWTTSLDRIIDDDGTYTIHAYGNDSIGNTIHVQTTFNVDTTPPEISILSPTNAIYGTEVLIDLSGDNDILWLMYNIEGVDIKNESWSQPVNVSLSDGSYLLHVYGSDSAGNIAHKTIFFTVDSVPPLVTIIRPSENLETPMQTESIKIVWSVTESSGFSETEIFVNGSLVTRVAFPCCVVEISLAEEGLHNIEVVVIDLAGNRGSALISVLVKFPEKLGESDNSTGFSVIFPLLSLIAIGLLLRRRIFIKKEV